jgi:transposase InsO family protein
MDRTEDGRSFKILNVIDEYSRECVGCLTQRRINSFDVLEFLAKLFLMRGQPAFIRSDNGPEFIAEKLRTWLSSLDVKLSTSLLVPHGKMATVKALMEG